jgi:hypothetical protein
MRVKNWLCAAALVAATGGTVMADTILPSDPSLRVAVNVDGDFRIGSGFIDWYGTTGGAQSLVSGGEFEFGAGTYAAGDYADAGVVLYFDGSLTLGQLQSVNLDGFVAGSTTPTVNLWLDTGNDNSFFAFGPPSYGQVFTGLAGDAYFGAATPGNITGGTTFDHLGGAGGGSYTLSQLQAGAQAGINADTKVALWIGITGTTDPAGAWARFSDIEVGTQAAAAPVPLPAAAGMGMALVGGLGGFRGIRNRLRRQPA